MNLSSTLIDIMMMMIFHAPHLGNLMTAGLSEKQKKGDSTIMKMS